MPRLQLPAASCAGELPFAAYGDRAKLKAAVMLQNERVAFVLFIYVQYYVVAALCKAEHGYAVRHVAMHDLQRLREKAAGIGPGKIFSAVQPVGYALKLLLIHAELIRIGRRICKPVKAFFKRSAGLPVFLQGLVLKRIKQLLYPFGQANMRKKTGAAAVHGDNGVIFWEHKHILPERAVELEGAFLVAHPYLIAIAVLHLAVWGLNLHAGSRVYPFFAYYRLAVPAAPVKAKLAELGSVLYRQRKPPAALLYALGASLPLVIAYAQRLIQPWRKEFRKAHSRALYQCGCKHI